MQSSRSVKSNTVRRDSITAQRPLKNIPRVEIYLDSQLTKAITKINQESALKNLSNPQRKFSIEQPQEQSFKPSLQFRRQSAFNIGSNQKSPTLMPNDVVLTYIKQVYQKYGIKNPFEGYLDENSKEGEKYFTFQKYPSFSDRKQRPQQQSEVQQSIKTQKKERKISQNQARIFQLKSKFKQTIENEPFVEENTLKKTQRIQARQISEENSAYDIDFIKKSQGNITYIERLTNLMESQVNDTYDFENESTFNKTGTHEETPERSLKHINKFYEQSSYEGMTDSPQVVKPKKKLFVKTRTTSTKYCQKQETPEYHKNLRVTFKDFESGIQETKLDDQQMKLASIIKIEQDQSVITSQVNDNIKRSSGYGLQIPQVYRYCLGCEAAILDSNVLFHQNKCINLKQIAQIPFDKIYEIVEEKIDRLRKEIIKSDLLNLELKDIDQIKFYASVILTQQNEMEQKKNLSKDFMKVGSFLSKKLLEGCELIKKLEWFTKVKENLQHNYMKVSKVSEVPSPNISRWQTR